MTNKRIVTALFLLFFGISSGFAQQRWSAGPRVGLNLTDLIGGSLDGKLLPGVAAGGFIMYSDINHFGVSLDVLYSQKGARYDLPFGSQNITFKQRINYLEVPIALRYFLNRSGNFRPNLFVGPAFGLRLGAKVSNDANDNTTDVTNQYRKGDFGVMGGFQLNFRVGEAQRLHIDARYTYGLTNIVASPTAATGNDLRNSTIALTVGYGIGLGRNY